jgi:tripartite-type tricarboxylate transporter receptor subunit TctC
MDMLRRSFVTAAVAAAAAPAIVRAQGAASWPNRPVKIVVPFPPAGSTDFMARLMGQKLTEALGQQFVIDNRPGAGGTVGIDVVAKAAPDGYTLGLASVATHAIAATLYAKLTFDPIKDFTPVSLIGTLPNILVLHPSMPVSSVPELIELLKKNPGKYSFASSGTGTSIHLSGEMFRWLAKVDAVHVPYRGSAPALQDLISGQTHFMFDNITPSLPHVRAGRLKALATTGPARSPATPDLPVMNDFVPGFVATSWSGLAFPAGTPRDIVEKLSAEMRKAVAAPDFVAKMAEVATEPRGSTPDEFAKFIAEESERWAKVVKASGAKVE